MLDIIPGVYQVASAYRNNDVNVYSQKVIRYALMLCCFNVLVAILTAVLGSGINDFLNAVISIILNGLVLHLAKRCVRAQNATWCCGIPALTFYRYFLIFNIVLVCINLIIIIAIVASGHFWAVVVLIYYVILFMLNFIQLHFSNKIVSALRIQVHPASTGNGAAAAAVSSSGPLFVNGTVPTTAVVQVRPQYARIEVDNLSYVYGNGNGNGNDNNGNNGNNGDSRGREAEGGGQYFRDPHISR